MTKQRRSFSAEFKREAAALVLDQGYSHIEACRSLGVVESALRRWVNQLQQERSGVTPQTKALFAPCMSEGGGLHGAFFSSDLDKDKCLYFISIDEVTSLFRQVGNDVACDIKWSRHPGTGVETLIVE